MAEIGARVIGVDPGTLRAGYGILDRKGPALKLVACGAIRPPRSAPMHQRLKFICDELTRVIAEHRPHSMAIESAFYGKSVNATIAIGQARAVALLCAANADIPVVEYAPRLVKKAAVGFGGAHKSQVQIMVQRVLGLAAPPEPHDAADAIAIALCHCHRQL